MNQTRPTLSPKLMPLCRRMQPSIASLLIVALALFPLSAPVSLANPTNPSVRHGEVSFDFSTPGQALIRQSSDRVIVDWETFSISSGETTRFIQPNTNSAALNRVYSGSPSTIHGNLRSNGQIFLINPNGILVGPSGRINTAGFVASTLDVSDAEFLAGGDMTFRGNSSAGIINMGSIESIDGGDIFLIAQEVENHGTLSAPRGTVGLAGGTEVLLKSSGSERISILPGSKGGRVTNSRSGQVRAAVAELKAAARPQQQGLRPRDRISKPGRENLSWLFPWRTCQKYRHRESLEIQWQWRRDLRESRKSRTDRRKRRRERSGRRRAASPSSSMTAPSA